MLNQTTTGQKILYYTLLVILAVIIIFPIYYMIIISLKIPRDIYRTPSLLPVNATLQNYVELLGEMGFLINIRNSLIVAGASTAISVFI
jgi:multiple sugar transport system permease protein